MHLRNTISRNAAFGFVAALLALLGGCASRPVGTAYANPGMPDFYRSVGLNSPVIITAVEARCVPPQEWIAEPLKQSERHTHQVWLSPTGKTAYGVIHFKLPLPVGVNLVYWEFMREMKRKEGDAIEISRADDPALPGLRFVCEGGRYRMRVNLIVDGFDGWAIYAGTLRAFDIVPDELVLAERARENTILGLPAPEASAK